MKLTAILLLAILATGCAREKQATTTGETSGDIPPLVSLCREIDYSDTATLHDKKIMEKRMREIIRLLPTTDSIVSDEALTILFNGIRHDRKAIVEATRLADTYLNSPASPFRNETLYIRLLKSLLAVDSLPEEVKLRAEDRLHTASLNRPGTIATDFQFVDRNGNRHNLHRFAGEEFLLIFYDPECAHCSGILRHLANDEAIESAISHGSLTVLAIYAEGKKDVWDDTKWDMPLNWTVGYDLTGILDKDLYDLPAMPILYLLDAEKRVILKDPYPQALHNFLLGK